MPVSNVPSQALENIQLDASVPVEFSDAHQQFLRFQLDRETAALLPIAQLIEVLKIPLGDLVPIPHMPEWVMGVYNWRSEILWMVDLASLVGLAPWYQRSMRPSHYTAIILNADPEENDATLDNPRTAIGLLVGAVDDIEWCNTDNLQFPPSMSIPSTFAPFLHGYWLKSEAEMLAVLDSEAIIAAMPISSMR